MRKSILFTFTIATLLAGTALAVDNLPAATGTLTSQADMTMVVDTAQGEMTFVTDDATKWLDPVNTGDTVLVRYDPENNHASEVFKVYEKIEVTDSLAGERRALYGTVTATGDHGVIIQSNQGQVFVLEPDRLDPPLPAAQDKVVLVYRVQELPEGEEGVATDLAILPDDYVLPRAGSVAMSSEQMETEEETVVAETTVETETTTVVETETETTPMYEPETTETETTKMASLPATASPLPLMALLGALSLSGGFALRRRNRK